MFDLGRQSSGRSCPNSIRPVAVFGDQPPALIILARVSPTGNMATTNGPWQSGLGPLSTQRRSQRSRPPSQRGPRSSRKSRKSRGGGPRISGGPLSGGSLSSSGLPTSGPGGPGGPLSGGPRISGAPLMSRDSAGRADPEGLGLLSVHDHDSCGLPQSTHRCSLVTGHRSAPRTKAWQPCGRRCAGNGRLPRRARPPHFRQQWPTAPERPARPVQQTLSTAMQPETRTASSSRALVLGGWA